MPTTDVAVPVQAGRRGGLRVEAVAAALAELDAATAIQRGAAWLDQQLPDWPDLINLDRLGLAHERWCVLGQVFGNFYRGLERLPDRVVGFGFDADRSGLSLTAHEGDAALAARYAALHTAWCRLIRQRRGEAAGDA